jgi:hypothetical protein
MTDTYFSASSYDALAGMLTGNVNGTFQVLYQNILAPQQGRAAVAAGTNALGNPTPALPAAGDPTLWYVGIRTDDSAPAITPPSGVTVCDDATGAAVLGVWE